MSAGTAGPDATSPGERQAGERRALPPPDREGGEPLTRTLQRRRSIRAFRPEPLSADRIGQLAWAAQGVSGPEGLRTAPSARALYPLELYVATSEATWRYEPGRHALLRVGGGDARPALQAATFGQEFVAGAPAVFAFAAVYERTTAELGPDATRFVHMDLGHAAQNLLLQATALGLGAVPVGALDPDRATAALGLPAEQRVIYLVPAGVPV